MKGKLLIVLLAMLFLIIPAFAETGQTANTYVNANLIGATYTVTVPVSVEVGQLNRMTNNQGEIAGVSVRSDVPWTLTVFSTENNMYDISDTSKKLTNPFLIYFSGLTAYVQPSTSPSMVGSASGTDIPVTITYRQLIDPNDAAGSYQIPLTFTVQPQ